MTDENKIATRWRLEEVIVCRDGALIGQAKRREVRVSFVVPYENFKEVRIQDALDALNGENYNPMRDDT